MIGSPTVNSARRIFKRYTLPQPFSSLPIPYQFLRTGSSVISGYCHSPALEISQSTANMSHGGHGGHDGHEMAKCSMNVRLHPSSLFAHCPLTFLPRPTDALHLGH